MSADGSVVIEIKGDSSDFDQEIKKTTQASEDLGKTSTDAVKALASALAAAGVAASFKEITEAIKACVDSSIAFESAITGVFKTVDGTPEQLAEISDGIKQMATEIPASTTEIAAVAEAAGQLGIATDDVLDFTRVMIDLGESTNLTADEAATALARFANITGTAAEDYERLGSTIVGLGNNFATTEAEIVSMSTRLASAGTLAGLSEPEILGLAAAMSSVGIEAEAGGTAMTQTLAAIETAVVNGGDKLETFAEIAGVSSEEFASAWESDAVGALQAFILGLSGLEAQGESAVLVLDELGLTGVRQSNMIQSLALASDKLSQAVALSNEAWESNTALSEEAGKRYETLESRLAMAENALNNVKIAIGDALTPALGELADMGTEAFSWAAEFIGQNPWLVQGLTAVTAALGVLVAGVAGLQIISSITPLIATFNAVLASNPMLVVAAAIAGVVVALSGLASEIDAATEAQEDFNEQLEESKEAHEDLVAEISEQSQNTIALASALDALSAKENKSASDKAQIKAIVEELNSAIPDLALAYDAEADALTRAGEAAEVTTASILAMAEAQVRQNQIDAMSDRAVEILTQRQQATEGLLAAQEQLTAAQAAYDAAAADYSERLNFGGAGDAMQTAQLQMQDAQTAIEGYNAALTALDAEYAVLEADINAFTAATTAAAETTQEAADANTKSARSAEELTAAYNGLIEDLQALQEAYDAAYVTAYNNISFFEQAPEIVATSVSDINAALDSQLAYMDTYAQNMAAAAAMGVDEGLLAELSDGSAESANILQGIVDGGEEKVSELNEKFGQVQQGREAFANEMAEMATGFSENMASIEARLTETVAEMEQSAEMSQAGMDTLQGYINGLNTKSGALYSTITGIANTAIARFKAALDSHSPSREFVDIGKDTIEGYILGVEDKHDDVKDAMKEAGELIIEAFPDEEMQEQAEALLDHYGDFWDEYVDKTEEYAKELEDALDDVSDRWDAVVKEQQAMTEKLSDFGDLLTTKITGVTVTGQKIETPALSNLQEQIDSLAQYGAALDALQERGISESLMSEVLAMSTEDALTYGNLLLQQSDEDWDDYMKKWEEKQALAQQIAEDYYADELGLLETEYAEKMESGMDALKETSFTVGEDTMRELLEGMRSKESELMAEAQRIAAAVSSALQEAVSSEVSSVSASLAVSSSAQDEARSAARSGGAIEAAGMIAAANLSNEDRDVVLNVDGVEFARATLKSYRAADDQSPRIVSD